MTDGRFYSRVVGIHERAEKVLAPADYSRACFARQSNCLDPGVGRRAIYLYAVLSHIGESL